MCRRGIRVAIALTLFTSGIAICIAATLLPHLQLEHGGDIHKFFLHQMDSVEGDIVAGEASPSDEENIAYNWYSTMIHIHSCIFAWILTDFYIRRNKVPKWTRKCIFWITLSAIATATFFIKIADDYSAPAVFFTKKDDSILSRKSFQGAYRIVGYRGPGAHMFPITPTFIVLLGYAMHE